MSLDKSICSKKKKVQPVGQMWPLFGFPAAVIKTINEVNRLDVFCVCVCVCVDQSVCRLFFCFSVEIRTRVNKLNIKISNNKIFIIMINIFLKNWLVLKKLKCIIYN